MRKLIKLQSIILLALIAAFFALLPKEGNATPKAMWDEYPHPQITVSDRK